MIRRILCFLFILFIMQPGFSAMRDPTMPPNYQGESFSAQNFTLSSILVAKDRTVARINNRFVTVGDEIGGTKVIDIKPSEVVLQGINGEIVLKLTGNFIK